jgi:phage baseplate assembly protein W
MDFRFIGSKNNIDQGTRNDILFDPLTKDIVTVSGADYVKQKMVKAILTSVNTDINFPTYGSTLTDEVFQNVSDPSTQQAIVSTILNALNYIEAQETSTRDDEHILSVDNVDLIVQPEQQSIYVKVDVTLRSNQTVTLAVGS